MAVEATFTPGNDEKVVLKDGENSKAVQAVVLVSPLGIPYAASGVSGGPGGTGDASAANQTTQITAANLTNSRIGAVDEAAAAADGTGSVSIIGALRRMLINGAAVLLRLPASLGAKAGSGSVSVVHAVGALTPVGGTITTGGTAQTLAAANSARVGLTVQNQSGALLMVNPAGMASATAGYLVNREQTLVLDAPHCGVGAVSIWGATTSQRFFGTEAV